MKKKVFLRGLLGFPLGVAIGYIITIIISLGWGKGNYFPCVPDLIHSVGSEIKAVVIQAALSGILGSAFAACSVIWELEHWSIAKQTGVYFLFTFLVMMPIAYVTNWMDHNWYGIIKYISIFVIMFIMVWITQYLIWKKKLKDMNDKLNANKKSS